jgi:hypothetical protein
MVEVEKEYLSVLLPRHSTNNSLSVPALLVGH